MQSVTGNRSGITEINYDKSWRKKRGKERRREYHKTTESTTLKTYLRRRLAKNASSLIMTARKNSTSQQWKINYTAGCVQIEAKSVRDSRWLTTDDNISRMMHSQCKVYGSCDVFEKKERERERRKRQLCRCLVTWNLCSRRDKITNRTRKAYFKKHRCSPTSSCSRCLLEFFEKWRRISYKLCREICIDERWRIFFYFKIFERVHKVD